MKKFQFSPVIMSACKLMDVCCLLQLPHLQVSTPAGSPSSPGSATLRHQAPDTPRPTEELREVGLCPRLHSTCPRLTWVPLRVGMDRETLEPASATRPSGWPSSGELAGGVAEEMGNTSYSESSRCFESQTVQDYMQAVKLHVNKFRWKSILIGRGGGGSCQLFKSGTE